MNSYNNTNIDDNYNIDNIQIDINNNNNGKVIDTRHISNSSIHQNGKTENNDTLVVEDDIRNSKL